MQSYRPKSDRGPIYALCAVALLGFSISSLVIISLISVYLPYKGANLPRSTICQLSFASMISQNTGRGPAVITTADFNNDNFLDLAVVNYDENSTSILLGNGNGAFTQQTQLSNGDNSQTNGLEVGDLNNDNKLDIVVVNSGTSSIGIFLGQGNGNFSPQTTYSTGTDSSPLGLALADLNRDNNLDIVVSDGTSNNLLIYNGNGDGTFNQISSRLSTGTDSKPYSIVINYFNKDNYLDIIVSNSGTNTIGVFIGNGQGSFTGPTTYSTGTDPKTLVAADFNRDNILDIATANYLGNNTSILLGNGDGTFQKQKIFSTGDGSLPFAIDSGDFNKDNIKDLIFPNSGTNNVGILLGYGNGKFRNIKTYSTGSGSYPDDIATGDFNRDNRTDFVSANYYSNTAGVFLNTCS